MTCRRVRKLSRSSSSHERRRGHSRMRASCASSTVPASTVTRRADRERVQNRLQLVALRLRGVRRELVQARAAPRVVGAIARLDESEEQLPRERRLGWIERRPSRVGGAGDARRARRRCARYASRVSVRPSRASHVARSVCARSGRPPASPGHLADQHVDETGLESQTDLARGLRRSPAAARRRSSGRAARGVRRRRPPDAGASAHRP